MDLEGEPELEAAAEANRRLGDLENAHVREAVEAGLARVMEATLRGLAS